MKKRKKRPFSLRSGLAAVTLLCWILPILIVTTAAGLLLNRNYNANRRQIADADAESAMHQAQIRMLSVLEDAKAVSYDGVVRQAYRDYLSDGVKAYVYQDVTEYLSQKFTRSGNYRAVFLSFLDEELDIHCYAASSGSTRLNLLRDYTGQIYPAVRELLSGLDTGIFFMEQDGQLYLARNLLDNRFVPYAILVIQLESQEVFQSVNAIAGITDQHLTVDGVMVPLPGTADAPHDGKTANVSYSIDADGHRMDFSAQVLTLSLWDTESYVSLAVAAVISLVIPLMIVIILLYRRHITHPMETLMDANAHVRDGEWGFQLREDAPNTEFALLYDHFNAMSAELRNQFDRLYQEQQALQQAKIKALQSQINPHFLNNTLEIINWEARLADNQRVCSMIEALSTMLDAAIGRDGRSRVPVREELKYVDAYLYITKERLGDRLTVRQEIDESCLEEKIPLLMLQPIIENAIEHDLSRAGGQLCLRVYPTQESGEPRLCFEVAHDGKISPEGWQNIQRALADAAVPPSPLRGSSVGLRNVNQRLKLLYGEKCSFRIWEVQPGKVLAKIVLPRENLSKNGQA